MSFVSRSILDVLLSFAWGNIEGLTETKLVISLGVSQCHWLEQIQTKLLAILDSQKQPPPLPTLYNAKFWLQCFCLKKIH